MKDRIRDPTILTSSCIPPILIALRHDILHTDDSEVENEWIGQTEGQRGRGETEHDESSGVKEHLQEGDDWNMAEKVHHGVTVGTPSFLFS